MSEINIHEYILGLKEPLSCEDLKPLIGEKFELIKMCSEWGRPVVDVDHLKITNIKASIDVETGLSDGQIFIYSDYILNDRVKYNAWNSVEGLQSYVREHLGRNHEEDNKTIAP